MAGENELEQIINEPSEADKRIKQLSGAVKQNAEDAEKARAEAAEKARIADEATRERDFYKGFADVVAQNPAARDYQNDILEKVKGGYTTEDATFAVLGKAGKLGVQTPSAPEPTGGSADISLPSQEEKTLDQMTVDEKRAILAESDSAIRDLLQRRV